MARLMIAHVAAVAALAMAGPALADVTAGQKTFQGQCSTCHAVTPGTNKIGPSLSGRRSARGIGRRLQVQCGDDEVGADVDGGRT